MEILENSSLKPFNTFGIDVRAAFFVKIKSVDDLIKIYADEKFKEIPKMILGGGSNILFTKFFSGIILKMEISGIQITKEDKHNVFVKVGAGENWHQFVLWCVENSYAGVENLSLIPGTVGASPIQNIGAYGVEVKNVLEEVEVMEVFNGKISTIKNKDCCFGYRDSIFKSSQKGKFIITNVIFKLKKQPDLNLSYGNITDTLQKMGIKTPTIKDVSNAVIKIRKSKLPDPEKIGNSGSFFKNPVISNTHFEKLQTKFPDIKGYKLSDDEVKVPAGWLIDNLGWKGCKEGEIGVHEKQALVLVNYGAGTGKEIFNFSEKIIQDVKKHYEISLEREVNVI